MVNLMTNYRVYFPIFISIELALQTTTNDKESLGSFTAHKMQSLLPISKIGRFGTSIGTICFRNSTGDSVDAERAVLTRGIGPNDLEGIGPNEKHWGSRRLVAGNLFRFNALGTRSKHKVGGVEVLGASIRSKDAKMYVCESASASSRKSCV